MYKLMILPVKFGEAITTVTSSALQLDGRGGSKGRGEMALEVTD